MSPECHVLRDKRRVKRRTIFEKVDDHSPFFRRRLPSANNRLHVGPFDGAQSLRPMTGAASPDWTDLAHRQQRGLSCSHCQRNPTYLANVWAGVVARVSKSPTFLTAIDATQHAPYLWLLSCFIPARSGCASSRVSPSAKFGPPLPSRARRMSECSETMLLQSSVWWVSAGSTPPYKLIPALPASVRLSPSLVHEDASCRPSASRDEGRGARGRRGDDTAREIASRDPASE